MQERCRDASAVVVVVARNAGLEVRVESEIVDQGLLATCWYIRASAGGLGVYIKLRPWQKTGKDNAEQVHSQNSNHQGRRWLYADHAARPSWHHHPASARRAERNLVPSPGCLARTGHEDEADVGVGWDV